MNFFSNIGNFLGGVAKNIGSFFGGNKGAASLEAYAPFGLTPNPTEQRAIQTIPSISRKVPTGQIQSIGESPQGIKVSNINQSTGKTESQFVPTVRPLITPAPPFQSGQLSYGPYLGPGAGPYQSPEQKAAAEAKTQAEKQGKVGQGGTSYISEGGSITPPPSSGQSGFGGDTSGGSANASLGGAVSAAGATDVGNTPEDKNKQGKQSQFTQIDLTTAQNAVRNGQLFGAGQSGLYKDAQGNLYSIGNVQVANQFASPAAGQGAAGSYGLPYEQNKGIMESIPGSPTAFKNTQTGEIFNLSGGYFQPTGSKDITTATSVNNAPTATSTSPLTAPISTSLNTGPIDVSKLLGGASKYSNTSPEALNAVNDPQGALQKTVDNIKANQPLITQNPVIDDPTQAAAKAASSDPHQFDINADAERAKLGIPGLTANYLKAKQDYEALQSGINVIIQDLKNNPEYPKGLAANRITEFSNENAVSLTNAYNRLTDAQFALDNANAQLNQNLGIEEFNINKQMTYQQQQTTDAKNQLNQILAANGWNDLTEDQKKQLWSAAGFSGEPPKNFTKQADWITSVGPNGELIQTNTINGEVRAVPRTKPTTAKNISTSTAKAYSMPPDTSQEQFDQVKNFIIANKQANPNMSYYDLWGKLADELTSEGLDPSTFDGLFWEYLSPQGLKGFQKQNSSTSNILGLTG